MSDQVSQYEKLIARAKAATGKAGDPKIDVSELEKFVASAPRNSQGSLDPFDTNPDVSKRRRIKRPKYEGPANVFQTTLPKKEK